MWASILDLLNQLGLLGPIQLLAVAVVALAVLRWLFDK